MILLIEMDKIFLKDLEKLLIQKYIIRQKLQQNR